MNRRMPNGTYGGVRGWGCEAPAYSIPPRCLQIPGSYCTLTSKDKPDGFISPVWFRVSLSLPRLVAKVQEGGPDPSMFGKAHDEEMLDLHDR